MPIYEYNCKQCGVFEVTQRITDAPLSTCPTCAGDVHRLISLTSFVLKGSGWYATDYARSNGKSESANKEGSGDASADKPAAADSAKTPAAQPEKSSSEKTDSAKTPA